MIPNTHKEKSVGDIFPSYFFFCVIFDVEYSQRNSVIHLEAIHNIDTWGKHTVAVPSPV